MQPGGQGDRRMGRWTGDAMFQPLRARPPLPVVAVVAGGVVLGTVPPMAGCGCSRAAPRASVPAPAIGRLTAITRRAAAGNGEPRQERTERHITDERLRRPAAACD